jgi:hypothetical protein
VIVLRHPKVYKTGIATNAIITTVENDTVYLFNSTGTVLWPS